MKTATEVFQKIRQSAEAISNCDTQRFPEAASVGDYWRQGDLYITLLNEVPINVELKTKFSLQLAGGTTQGSRHILDSADGIKYYLVKNADALQGPILVLSKERTITHPEHGDVILPCGTYEITYQRAFAEELKRVLD